MEAHAASKGRYGSPRVHAERKAAGERVGRKRVARLMREEEAGGADAAPFPHDHRLEARFPDRAERARTGLHGECPQSGVGHRHHVSPDGPGLAVLAVILDLFPRRVVGWATSQEVDRHLALAALDTALARRRPAPGLVHHSDRGSTYASTDCRKALDAKGLECSMSRKGDCWDNAVAESFFSTLKRELEGIDDFESRAGAALSIGDYIDGFYNIQRRHSAINYTSPVEFELIHSVQRAAA